MKYGSGIQYGIVDPTYTPLQGQDILYENVSTGDLWHFDTNLSIWECITCSAATCPPPMTSAALQTHITNSTLMPGCDYTITDHTQGNLGTVSVTVRATTTNTVSHEAMVKTSFHTQAWRGLYDAQNQLLVELRDHRDNIVSGFSGVEIGAFDWNNGNITNCQVSNATLLLTPGFSYVLNGLRLTTGGTLDLTGKVSGSLNNVTVKDDATVMLNNSTVQITDCTFDNSISVNFTNYTGAGNIENSVFSDYVAVDFSNNGRSVTIINSKFYNGLFINAGMPVASGLLIQDSRFYNSKINVYNSNTKYASIKDCTFMDTKIDSYFGESNFANSELNKDQFTFNGTSFDINTIDAVISNKSIYEISAKAATTTSYYTIANSVVNKSTINNIQNAGSTTSINNVNINSSTITKRGLQVFNIEDSKVDTKSVIESSDIATGYINIINSNISENSRLLSNGGGNTDITDSNISDNAILENNGGRGLVINKSMIHSGARVYSNNLSTGFDIVDQVEASNKAFIILNASGAIANGIRWSTIIGGPYYDAPTLQILGTSSGQEIQFCTIDHSMLEVRDCSTAEFQRLKLQNNALLKCTNITAIKVLYDINISSAILDMHDCNTAGDIRHIYMNGISYPSEITGSTINVYKLYSNSSPFVVSSGIVSNLQLSGGGVFNSGGFYQTNVIYNSPTNITCTVANTNATTITGITSSNPVL